MTLYRIPLHLRSPLATPLKGDTLWGHVVWGLAYHEGDGAVEQFLTHARAGDPSLVVSSAFPRGLLCKPLPAPVPRDRNMDMDRYARMKEEMKFRYAPAGNFLTGAPQPHTKRTIFETVPVIHNVMDRLTNTVQEGGLWTAEERWPRLEEWDLYALSPDGPDRVAQMFEWAFEGGYGADASIGKGRIALEGKPEPVPPSPGGTWVYMALGPLVKAPDQPIDRLRGDLFLRIGRIGGAFAARLSPYKKPVLLYDEGAVFHSPRPLEYAGRLLTGVHQDERICQSGFAPVIPIEEKGEKSE
jgi:CRISPR-associated protein Csm4